MSDIEDDDGVVTRCRVEGCRRRAAGYAQRDVEGQWETLVGIPDKPAHVPLCAKHLAQVDAEGFDVPQ